MSENLAVLRSDEQPPSVIAAASLLSELITAGMRHIVLSPGSRSAPLAYAAAAADADGLIRLHVRFDERSAGFLALGLAQGTREPIAIITTSGTAVANLHPSILEAHHSHLPLVALTADRPQDWRDSGANQTTNHMGVFNDAIRHDWDLATPETGREWDGVGAAVIRAALGDADNHPGPVHVNCAFADPLVPTLSYGTGRSVTATSEVTALAPEDITGQPADVAIREGDTHVQDGVAHMPQETGGDALIPERAVIIVGAGANATSSHGHTDSTWITDLAVARSWPLFVEPGAPGHTHPQAIVGHQLLLASAPVSEEITTAIVIGRPTLARPVTQLITNPDVTVHIIDDGARRTPDVSRRVAHRHSGVPANWLAEQRTEAEGQWLAQWTSLSATASAVIADHAREGSSGCTPALTGLAVAAAIADVARPEDRLVVGSSASARDIDLVSTRIDADIITNRGLSGIDGLVSTAIGVAATAPHQARTYAMLGDLTFLHDSNGLFIPTDEQQPDLTIVVLNDHGGAIFDTLEQGRLARASSAAASQFQRIFATPQHADIAALCTAWNVPHTRVDTATDLVTTLTDRSTRGLRVIEATVDRFGRRERNTALLAGLRAAFRPATSS